MTQTLLTRAFVVFGFALLGCTAASAQDAGRAPQPDVVVTVGEAVVKVTPDLAFVTIAVENRSKMPRDAERQNAETMTAVQQKLQAAGLPREAVRTIAIELSPEFDYANGRQTLRGYVARNTIEVRVEALPRLGDVIDAAVASGATNVTGVRFDVRKREEIERDALRQAVTQARTRAESAAAGAGRNLDRVIRIEEGGAEPMPPPRPIMYAARAEAAPMTTPVAPGEIEIRARVTLTAALR